LLEVLPGCSLMIGSAQAVLGRRGSSHQMNGLPDESMVPAANASRRAHAAGAEPGR
jgi:hypothetical protein